MNVKKYIQQIRRKDLKNNKYTEIKKKEIEDIISKIDENIINIEDLNNTQKDDLIGYYNQEICTKKEHIKKLKEKIKRKKGIIL